MKLHTLLGTAALFVLLPGHLLGQPNQDPPFKLPDSVEQKSDVVYGKGGERDLKLDLFLPKEGEGLRPAIVFIHGGGWQGGTRKAFQRQAAYLASKGYVGACIEYRLSGEAKFPAAVEDCKCAVRFLRASAKAYRIDVERIASCGGSAGGHLAAFLGVTDKSLGYEGTGGHADQSSKVQLVIDFNGVSDMEALGKGGAATSPIARFLGATFAEKPELYKQSSPITYVSKQSPPTLFLHGTGDNTVPIEQSRAMLKKLKDAGVKAELYEAEGAGHGFFNRPPHFEPTLKKMEAFLAEHFRKELSPAADKRR